MIELFSSPSPNGQKVMIMLEETGLDWRHIDVNLRLGDQFTQQHLRLSPNNKIPAIIDYDGPSGGPYSMMESGAILWYLAEKTGKFLPTDPRKRYDTLQWLMFQMAHVGPMFGQSGHFNSFQNEPSLQYARDRYNNEALRIYRVLDNRLKEKPWIAGDEYTIADMAIYPWTKGHKERDISSENHPGFMRWFAAMEARPAVRRNNELAAVIRERMNKAAESTPQINIYDTKDNAERLTRATTAAG